VRCGGVSCAVTAWNWRRRGTTRSDRDPDNDRELPGVAQACFDPVRCRLAEVDYDAGHQGLRLVDRDPHAADQVVPADA
jgi:hypothetical protein